MLLLLSGRVQVYETDPSGRELTLAVLGYGTSIGATGLVSRRTRELRVRAMEARWADLASKEVSARLASMLLQLVESEGVMTAGGIRIATRYTHRQLAAMIGSNREATTRALGQLRREGAVRLRDRYIYVTNMEALKRAAE